MDLKTRAAPPTDAERAAVESVLGAARPRRPHVLSGGHVDKARRHLLLPDTARRATTASAGSARPRSTTSPNGSTSPRPRSTGSPASTPCSRSCRATHTRCTSAPTSPAAPTAARPPPTLPAGDARLPCLGLCERAPAALVIDAGDPSTGRRRARHPVEIDAWAAGRSRPERRRLPQCPRPATTRSCCCVVPAASTRSTSTPTSPTVVSPRSPGRRELGPEGVIAAGRPQSGLVGRGGAAFPTGRKWEAVAHPAGAPPLPDLQRRRVRARHVQGPGADRDRPVQRRRVDVHRRLRHRQRAGLRLHPRRVPARRGDARERIDAARAAGCSAPTLGDGFDIDIESSRGAGAYICGEETAIFNSIEGHRGEPRNKPPFPFEVGLFGKPTAGQQRRDARQRAGDRAPRAHARNRRLFCLSGAVVRPGVYEVELGITLGQLIELAGGMRPGFRAAGGAARRRGGRLRRPGRPRPRARQGLHARPGSRSGPAS